MDVVFQKKNQKKEEFTRSGDTEQAHVAELLPELPDLGKVVVGVNARGVRREPGVGKLADRVLELWRTKGSGQDMSNCSKETC